ncbi:cupin domain-containing protein [Legionella sp.]|uniref:cupin domain-containing protein n=1 Tax=Legionella sp. TaxID=459 RepID=UPI003C9D39FB
MQISLKHQTKKHADSPAFLVTEHVLNDAMADLCIAELTGRHPEQHYIINKECNLFVYIFEGKGIINVNNHKQKISAGDALMIEAGEKYYWEGTMKLFISSRPAWNAAQHQVVE